MLQLEILTGKQAGLLWEARRFPVRVGRAADCELCLEDAGVWEQHCEIELPSSDGFHLKALGAAGLLVNQTPVTRVRLKSGDLISAGAVQLSFRLAPTRPASLRWREWLVWALLTGISLGQLGLLIWLMRD